MKVCILSDSHDHIPLIDAAVADAKAAGAEAVLHCGDVVAPSTLHCLEKYGLPVHVIHGNNPGDLYMMGHIASKPSSLVGSSVDWIVAGLPVGRGLRGRLGWRGPTSSDGRPCRRGHIPPGTGCWPPPPVWTRSAVTPTIPADRPPYCSSSIQVADR